MVLFSRLVHSFLFSAEHYMRERERKRERESARAHFSLPSLSYSVIDILTYHRAFRAPCSLRALAHPRTVNTHTHAYNAYAYVCDLCLIRRLR